MKRIAASLLLLTALAPVAASASKLDYHFQAVVDTGTLNGVSLHGDLIEVLITADNNNSGPFLSGYAVPASGLGQFYINGQLSARFLAPLEVYDNQANGSIGVQLLSGTDILINKNSAFTTYDLFTPLGPIEGFTRFNPGQGFATTAGTLEFDTLSPKTIFLSDPTPPGNHDHPTPDPSPTPEPSALTLLGSGLAGIASVVRRRRRS